MTEECPGATDSPTKPSESGRRRFAGISFEALKVGKATNDTCGRVEGLHQGGHLVTPEREFLLQGRKAGQWRIVRSAGSGKGDQIDALARRAPQLEQLFRPDACKRIKAVGSPGAGHCPARRGADGGAATTASRPGRPGQRRAVAKRPPHLPRH
eukprot:6188230-Pleurochrysis_carterae.AAC.1